MGTKEYVMKGIAPRTRIGVRSSDDHVIISHEFPVELESTIASCFVNTAQGFVCTSLTIPAADALALVTLIGEHVPEGALNDDEFNQATAEIRDIGTLVTIGTARRLTNEERAQSDLPETFTIRKNEGRWYRVLIVLSFAGARSIAAAIEEISVEIVRKLTEHIPKPPE